MSNIKKVIVDDREFSNGQKQKRFKEQVIKHFGKDKVSIERLPVADFIIILDDGTKVAIERKQDLDWISSCIKRRVQSQAIKMVENFDYRFVIIIGSYDSIQKNREFVEFSKKQWISNMVSLQVRYKTPVFMVETTLDFLKMIDSIAKMVNRETEPLEKPKVITNSGSVRMDILATIPTIGKVKAKRLIEYFGSVENIINSDEKIISSVQGVSKKNASEILRWLK